MEETITETILNNKDTVNNIRRFSIGALMALSIPLGIPAVVATGAFCVGLNTAVFGVEKKMRERRLVDFYRDEIASLQDKTPESVTMDDLRKTAAPASEGGKNVVILGNELSEQKTNHKFRMLYSVVASAITTGTLVGLSLAFPGFITGAMSMLLGLGLVGLGHTLIAATVRGAGNLIFGKHDADNTVSQRLIRVADEIKHHPVSPVEIFSLTVDTHPELQKEIKEKYGKNFADLPIIQKQQVVESYEPQLRIIGLTAEINNGNIRPSMAGFIMSHQLDESLPDYHDFKALFNKPVARIPNKEPAIPNEATDRLHAKRILAEREESSPSKSLH